MDSRSASRVSNGLCRSTCISVSDSNSLPDFVAGATKLTVETPPGACVSALL
jgi:hypothetical protein